MKDQSAEDEDACKDVIVRGDTCSDFERIKRKSLWASQRRLRLRCRIAMPNTQCLYLRVVNKQTTHSLTDRALAPRLYAYSVAIYVTFKFIEVL